MATAGDPIRAAATARVSSYQSKNKAFGPGTFKYRPSYEGNNSPFSRHYQANQEHNYPRGGYHNSGIYHGGSKARPIPQGGKLGTGAGTYRQENMSRA